MLGGINLKLVASMGLTKVRKGLKSDKRFRTIEFWSKQNHFSVKLCFSNKFNQKNFKFSNILKSVPYLNLANPIKVMKKVFYNSTIHTNNNNNNNHKMVLLSMAIRSNEKQKLYKIELKT